MFLRYLLFVMRKDRGMLVLYVCVHSPAALTCKCVLLGSRVQSLSTLLQWPLLQLQGGGAVAMALDGWLGCGPVLALSSGGHRPGALVFSSYAALPHTASMVPGKF